MRTKPWTIDDELLAITEDVWWSCPERPEQFINAPIGQYHCPWCGCMQIAGIPHFPHDVHCRLGLWDPTRDPMLMEG